MPRTLLLFALLAVAACKSKEEKLASAEQQAQLLAETKARLAKGIGEAMQGEGKAAAQAVAAGAGEMVKGIGKGLDKSIKEVKVLVAANLAEQGVKVTRGSHGEGGEGKVVSVYVVFDKPYAGSLELRALDEAKAEVGRAQAKVDEKAPNAKYLDFTFDARAPIDMLADFELR
jgi:hypothetical protein